ncbi:MAG: hypothetical protein ACRC7W_00560 [Fusobacteriaceae bacterium]
MRFEVNEVILLVGVNFSMTGFDGRRGDRGFTFRIPQPNDIINEIKFVESTVKEHHKVPGEWDDEAKYDGFIFDVQGNRGTNQYPRAAYGQMSDAQNWVISIADDLYHNKYNEDFDKLEASNEIYYYTTATNAFDIIKRGIRQFTESKSTDYVERLKEHLELFTKALNDQFPEYKIGEKEIIKDTGIYHTVIEKV